MSISKVNVSGTNHQIVGSPRYATCSTAAATSAKVATIADGSSTFVLEKGARICVSFTYANTASAATLNVASTGAKAICWNGSALVSSQYWQAGAVVDFVYDGNGWSIVGVAKDRPVFYVTITGTVASPTADKTLAEIYQAYENGYAVYANVTLTGSGSSTNLKGLLPLTYIIAGIDGQHAITFSSTSGKEIKEVRYSPAIRKWEVPYSGVIATNDDLPSTPSDIGAQPKITAKGLLKGNGNGGVSAAVKGTDYAGPSVGVSVTLRASGWNANAKTQTVSVAGVTATANCIITAAPDSYMAYAEAGVRCTAQGAGTLTFACETVPTADVAANVLILG